jgi:hypothetical protein
MTDKKVLRDAIGVAFAEPNFMAKAAQLNGPQLRHLLAQRLAEAGLDVEVIAAIASGDFPPYYQADMVWREGRDGDLTHQTVRWALAPGPSPVTISTSRLHDTPHTDRSSPDSTVPGHPFITRFIHQSKETTT